MNIKRLGSTLNSVLNTEEAYEILGDNGTWTYGGCLLLARTLKRFIGDKAIICAMGDDLCAHGHAIVKYGKYYLDGDGISNESQLIRRWTIFELRPNPRIVEFNANLCSDWLWSQRQENALFELLTKRLGGKKGEV